MENRKYKINGEDIREVISKEWNLSIVENDALDTFIEALKDGNLDDLKISTASIEQDWDYVLSRIPDSDIEWYAENNLDMYSGKVTIEDFDNDEILDEVKDRGLIDFEATNLKDDTDREELNKLFFSKTWAEREQILKQLRE